MNGSALTVLEVHDLWKSYAHRPVLRGVSMTLAPGEIRALVGMNGSGKSTLVKILAGAVSPDRPAQVDVGGRVMRVPTTPEQARAAGLRFVHQELALVLQRPLVENLAYGRRELPHRFGIVDWKREAERCRPLLAAFGLEDRVFDLVGSLSRSEKTLLSLARALDPGEGGERATVLILDEPTVGLSSHDTVEVLKKLEGVAAQGTAILLVSHSIADVINFCHSITVLRDGETKLTGSASSFSHADLVEAMSGSSVSRGGGDLRSGAAARPGSRELLRVEHLSAHDAGVRLEDISFCSEEGEVVGLAGDQNSGTSYLLEVLYGLYPARWLRLAIAGTELQSTSIRGALRLGMAYIPADRMGGACFPGLTVAENLLVALDSGHRALRPLRAERRQVAELMRRFAIQPPVPGINVDQLSGGNQQKVALARVLSGPARLILLDEPSQGLDAVAHRQLMASITDIARAEGRTFLISSTDLEFLAGACTQVLVFADGEVSTQLRGDRMTATAIRRAMLGAAPDTE